MATLSVSDIADLITTTQKELGRLKFNQIATRLQDYECFRRIMKQDRVELQSGTSIQRNIMVDHSGAAKQVGLHQVDDPNIGDVMQTIEAPWRHTQTHYGYERREFLINRSPARIVDLVKVRRTDGLISLAEHVEDEWWNTPTGATDELSIWGVPYWVTSNSSTGFNGGAEFGSTVGGLNPTTYPRFKNYTALYTNVTKQDLVRKMRVAAKKTRFQSPVDITDYRTGRGQRWRIYMDEPTETAWEELAENQNENLGRDLAPMDGNTTFRRTPVVWVPKLDGFASDSSLPDNPVYFLDWAYWEVTFLRGDYLQETEPLRMPEQHNDLVVYVDLTWNAICTDRRRQACLATAVPTT